MLLGHPAPPLVDRTPPSALLLTHGRLQPTLPVAVVLVAAVVVVVVR